MYMIMNDQEGKRGILKLREKDREDSVRERNFNLIRESESERGFYDVSEILFSHWLCCL